MPRNSSGTYALPAGNPVVSNTLIQSTWANNTCSDLGSSITDSLDRNGRGAMLAPLKNVDGTAVAPSITFSSEGTLGAFRAAAGVLGIAAGGALVLSISATGLTFANPLVIPLGTAAAPSLTFTGNTNTGLYSPATNQVALTTNGAQRLLVDATGIVTLAGSQVAFSASGANLITASNAAGTLALQTGGANTRLSIDAAGLVTVAQGTTLTGAVGIGGANALGKLQVFGGIIVIDNGQSYTIKNSGGTASPVITLDGSNNLILGGSTAVATTQIATGGATRVTVDASGNLGFRTAPSAWGLLTAIEGTGGAVAFNGGVTTYWMQNLYYDGSNFRYKATGAASMVLQSNGRHEFYAVPSGSAGSTVSPTQTAGIDISGLNVTGNILVNTGTAAWAAGGRGLVEVNGSSTALIGLKSGGTQGAYFYYDGTNAHVQAVSGALTLDAGGTTRVSIASTGQSTFTGAATTAAVNSFNGGTGFALDCRLSNVFQIVMTGNIAAAAASGQFANMGDGQTINIFLTQDGTGSRTWAMPSANGFKWPGGSVGVLSTAAGSVDLLIVTYRASTGFYYCTLAKGFA